MAEEHCVARGPTDHGEHREPHVRQRLRGEAAVTDAQHVGHGLEQGPRVLLQPVGLLQRTNATLLVKMTFRLGLGVRRSGSQICFQYVKSYRHPELKYIC